ncbi:LamG domain-containing protein [Candidatus Pacearchaeota archaeon]|nr:LamG domain-containing protein [Candidatus Pacearchaeota archaeon]
MNGKKWGFVVVVGIAIIVLSVFFYRQIITGRQIAIESAMLPTQISFTNPTPQNNTLIKEDFLINVSIIDSDLKSTILNLDGMNHTFYDDSLVLMMNFDNRSALGENSTYIVDLSRYGNNGTINGASSVQGKHSRALQFNGISDFIYTKSNDFNLDAGKSLAIGTWFRTSFIGTQFLVDHYGNTDASCTAGGSSSSSAWILIDMSSGQLRFAVRDDTIAPDTQSLYSNGSFNDGEWHHVFGIIDKMSTRLKLYIDGRLNNETALAYTGAYTFDDPLYIGTRCGPGAEGTHSFFNGSIDEVRIWNRSLSSDDIKEQYYSNLFKYNSTQWYLNVNQSNLTEKSYSFQAFASDNVGNQNSTEVRTIIYNIAPSILFISPTPDNGASTTSKNIDINASIFESNLRKLILNWNNINHTFYDDSLVLMMNFDNRSALGENDSFVRDLSIYGNDGTCLVANCPKSNASGRYGGAFELDGINDYIELKNSIKFGSGDFSYEAWIMISASSSVNDLRIISDDHDLLNLRAFVIQKVTNGVQFWCRDSLGNEVNPSSSAINDGKWHHIVGSRGGQTGYLYVDGLLADSITNSTLGSCDGDTATFIGARNATSPSLFFNGSIDEVRIWNRSLSSDEVKQHYYSNLQKFNNNQWNLEVHQSDLADSAYSYFACAKDIFSESCTGARIITIASITESISGGGGGAPSAPTTYFVGENQLFQGVYINISRTERINFSIFGSTHLIKYESFSKSIYNFAVDSQKISMGIGNESVFDFNKDGIEDFVIRLVNHTSKAHLYLKGTVPVVIEEEKPEENKTEFVIPPQEKERPKSWLFIVRNEIFFYIIFAIIFIGLIVVMVFIYLHVHQAVIDRKPKERRFIIHEETKQDKQKLVQLKQRIITGKLNLEFLLNQKIRSLRIKAFAGLLVVISGLVLVSLFIYLGFKDIVSGIIVYSADSVISFAILIAFIIFLASRKKKKKLEHYLNVWQLKKLMIQRALLEGQNIPSQDVS